MKKEVLYKYRSLSNLKRIIEIALDEKIYASRYKNLNDPMEGYYSYSEDIKPYRKEINKLKERSLICSFSKSQYIGLLWVMYADEGRGCCLEIEVKKNSWERVEVDYKDQIPKITDSKDINIQNIFKCKPSIWKYEQEVRYVKESDKMLKVPATIKKIYLGYAYTRSSKEYEFYKELFEKRLGIQVEFIDKNEIDFGYTKNA